MKPRSSHSLGDDRGAVLPLVLVATIVFALVVAAVATYTVTALRTTQVTEARVDRLAAAEAGMQEALLRASTTGACPTDADLGDRNGAVVTVSGCATESVTMGEDVPYSLIVTARGLDAGTLAFVRRNAQSRTVELGGQVYLSQTAYATGSANPDHLVATGRVVAQAASCPESGRLDAPDWLGVVDVECTELPWNEFTDVPLVDPATPAVNVDEPRRCDLFEAGTYSNVNAAGDVYFASGIYRISGELSLSGTVVAGHNGAVTLPSTSPCHDAQRDDVNSASSTVGVVFVLEDGGSITVGGNRTTVEFYGLQTGDRTLSLVAYTDGFEDPNGEFRNSTRDPDNDNQPVVRIPNGAPNATFSFFGELWAPNGFIYLRQMSSSGAAGAAFQGGAVISRFEGWTSADVSGLIFSGDVAPVMDFFRLRVTATAQGGDTTVSVVAREDQAGEFVVQSWRVL